jgi:hypothetical protein
LVLYGAPRGQTQAPRLFSSSRTAWSVFAREPVPSCRLAAIGTLHGSAAAYSRQRWRNRQLVFIYQEFYDYMVPQSARLLHFLLHVEAVSGPLNMTLASGSSTRLRHCLLRAGYLKYEQASASSSYFGRSS